MNEPSKPEVLLEAGLHLGHKSQRLHPRFRQYVHKIESGSVIIDLFKTAPLLDKALEFVHNLGKEGKTLLVVGTKKQAHTIVEQLCKTQEVPYLTHKWIGGFLTNFEEIKKNISHLVTLKKEKNEGAWSKFVKHERVALEKKLHKVALLYQGVQTLEKPPDALFVVDAVYEKNAVREGVMMNTPVVGLIDTNGDPDVITYPIPANDDAPSSIMYVSEKIINAYSEGKGKKS